MGHLNIMKGRPPHRRVAHPLDVLRTWPILLRTGAAGIGEGVGVDGHDHVVKSVRRDGVSGRAACVNAVVGFVHRVLGDGVSSSKTEIGDAVSRVGDGVGLHECVTCRAHNVQGNVGVIQFVGIHVRAQSATRSVDTVTGASVGDSIFRHGRVTRVKPDADGSGESNAGTQVGYGVTGNGVGCCAGGYHDAVQGILNVVVGDIDLASS